MSDRISFLTNPTGGAQVLLMNFAGFAAPADALPHIAAAAALIAEQPTASVRTMVDVTGSKCNIEVVESLKQFVAGNRPYVIASAIIGMSGLQRIILDGILTFSSRSNLKSFAERAEALQWLASM
ncbi:MAG: hypothetical protein ACR2MQ_07990 [Gemmatimonadaceae bacterium]